MLSLLAATTMAAAGQEPALQWIDLGLTSGIDLGFFQLPTYGLLLGRLSAQYPWVMRLVKWKFRKSMERYEAKHFSGRRNGANFKQYKEYRLMLFRRTA